MDVCIQVLHADGGVLGACINAAMLAAADAGVGVTRALHRGLSNARPSPCVHERLLGFQGSP